MLCPFDLDKKNQLDQSEFIDQQDTTINSTQKKISNDLSDQSSSSLSFNLDNQVFIFEFKIKNRLIDHFNQLTSSLFDTITSTDKQNLYEENRKLIFLLSELTSIDESTVDNQLQKIKTDQVFILLDHQTRMRIIDQLIINKNHLSTSLSITNETKKQLMQKNNQLVKIMLDLPLNRGELNVTNQGTGN